MNKYTILKIFGEAFLRATVIIMGIAILGFGGFFLVQVVTGSGDDENKTTQELTDEQLKQMLEEEEATAEADTTEDITEATTEEVTEEPTTEQAATPSNNLKILVLNSTATKGLAQAWVDKLVAAGMVTVDKGNYSSQRLTATKIIVKDETMGKDLQSQFKNASIEVGTAPSGIDVSTEGYDIFIIIGTEDDIK